MLLLIFFGVLQATLCVLHVNNELVRVVFLHGVSSWVKMIELQTTFKLKISTSSLSYSFVNEITGLTL